MQWILFKDELPPKFEPVLFCRRYEAKDGAVEYHYDVGERTRDGDQMQTSDRDYAFINKTQFSSGLYAWAMIDPPRF